MAGGRAGGRWATACAVALTAALTVGGVAPAPAGAEAKPPGRLTMTELLDPNGEPLQQAPRINERGEVIGVMASADLPFGQAPVLWRRGRATRLSPEGGSGVPYALSERGQVVGDVHPDAGPVRPFSWTRGEWSVLTPHGVPGAAVDVNDRGQVLGWANRPGAESRVVAWNRGRAVRAPAVATGTVDLTYGVGDQLNERGQAVVEVHGDGFSRAAIWQIGGGITELGGHGVYGLTINERGHVAGVDYRAEGPTHVLLWRDGRTLDAGAPGGTSVTAAAINEHDDIVGWAHLPEGGVRGFLWRDGEMIDIGALGGDSTYALDVNDRGQVVGHTSTADGESSHGFVWEDGHMTDLGEGTAAYQLNDRGQILGTAGGFEASPVLWTLPAGHGHDT
jgi:probable HAF family extracellular repeat protein